MWNTYRDTELANRVTVLEELEYEIELYHTIESSPQGDVQKAQHAEIIFDQYEGLADCLILQVDSQTGRPIEKVVRDANNEIVVSSLDINGLYDITNEAPFSYPVDLVYQVKIKAKYLNEIDPSSIIKSIEISNANSVLYDNSTSGLDAFEVQSALDEINEKRRYLSVGVADSSPPSFLDNGDGTATVASCNMYLFASPNFTGTIEKFTVPSATLSFTPNTSQYIAVNYNSGVPIYEVRVSSTINGSNIVPIYKVWRQNNTLHSLDADSQGLGLSNKIANMILSTNPYKRAGENGLIIAETITPNPRTITVSSSYVFAGTTGIPVLAYNSSTDILTHVYHTTGIWTYSNSSAVYNNTSYDNGTDLVAIPSNKFAVRWFYRSIGDSKEVFYVNGSSYYNTLSDAKAEGLRTDLPTVVREHCLLVGRAIIQQGATSGITETVFGISFGGSTGSLNHNDTLNIQGGLGTDFYHLSKPEYDYVNNVQAITKDFTGFNDPSAVVQSYDPTTRTVTLTGTFTAWYRGQLVPVLTNGWTSSAHAATNGDWFLYYNGSTFIWSQTVWSFDMMQIAKGYYSANDKFAIRECHGTMPHLVHQELHETVGCYKYSGGTLSNYTLASTTVAQRRPDVSSTTIKDEDVPTINAALTSKLYTLVYNTGVGTAISNFTVDSSDIVPLLVNNPYYNSFATNTWGQTLMANNSYSSIWLLAVPTTSDAISQKYRYLWIQGQTNNVVLANEQAIQSSSLNLGSLTSALSECVFLAKVIIRYTGGNWQLQQIDILSGNRISQTSNPAGTFLSAVSTDTTLTGAGTTASPLGLASPLTYSKSLGLLATGSNLDSITTGWWRLWNGNTYTNTPTWALSNDGVVNTYENSQDATQCTYQTFHNINGQSGFRIKSSGTWSAWIRQYNDLSDTTIPMARSQIATGISLDTIQTAGIYRCMGANTYTNNPFVGSDFLLTVEYYGANIVVQRAVETITNNVKIRTLYGTWTSWVREFNTSTDTDIFRSSASAPATGTDLNTLTTQAGIYVMAYTFPNSPFPAGELYMLSVEKYSSTVTIQRAIGTATTYSRRMYGAGTWSNWLQDSFNYAGYIASGDAKAKIIELASKGVGSFYSVSPCTNTPEGAGASTLSWNYTFFRQYPGTSSGTGMVFANNLNGADCELYWAYYVNNTLGDWKKFQTTTNTYDGVANLGSIAGANIQSVNSSSYRSSYMRVGNTVTVSGMVAVDLTSANTYSTFKLQLPIARATNFPGSAGVAYAGGTAVVVAGSVPGVIGAWAIQASPGDTSYVNFSCDSMNTVSAFNLSYNFTYSLI